MDRGTRDALEEVAIVFFALIVLAVAAVLAARALAG